MQRKKIQGRNWPTTQDAFGWLSLDPRGYWRIKGKRIDNPNLIGFINKNYMSDKHGRYFFQNGNQRVFVNLTIAPFVIRVIHVNPLQLITQTGVLIQNVDKIWFDKKMNLILKIGPIYGSLDDRDIPHVYNNLITKTGSRLSELEQEYGANDNESLLHVDIFLDYKSKKLKIAATGNYTDYSGHFTQKPGPISR